MEPVIIVSVLLLLCLAAAGVRIYRTNHSFTVTERQITFAGLPEAFDGFKIAHISDLHNYQHGPDNRLLLEKIREQKPDLIAVTGDLIDSYHPDTAVGVRLIQAAVQIAPVYFVGGNHEARIPEEYAAFKREAARAGAAVLEDGGVRLTRGGAAIDLYGIKDPHFSDAEERDNAAVIAERLRGLHIDPDGFSVLLSHRPELFRVYCDAGIDLVLSGHAHGGQVRLPLLGGLYAPHQGVFPKYTDGLYVRGKTVMAVSRGLGNSRFRPRVNCRPQAVILTLSCRESNPVGLGAGK